MNIAIDENYYTQSQNWNQLAQNCQSSAYLYYPPVEPAPVPYLKCKCGRDIVMTPAVLKALREAKEWKPSFKVSCDYHDCAHEQVVDGNTSFRIK